MGKSDEIDPWKYFCRVCRVDVRASAGPMHSGKGHKLDLIEYPCNEQHPVDWDKRCKLPNRHEGDHDSDGYTWLNDPAMYNDNVNHPKHYTSDPSGIECIQITRHRNFNVGNAIKYLWRAGLKDSDISGKGVEDLEKAVWYIKDEIKRIESTGSK